MTVKLKPYNGIDRKRSYDFSFPILAKDEFQQKVKKLTKTTQTQTEVDSTTKPSDTSTSLCSPGTPVKISATLAYEGPGRI